MRSHPLDSAPPAVVAQPIHRVLVFCGSRSGADPRHARLAADVGRLFAARGIGLVYGGGALGLMGEAGRATLGAGGAAHGIIPQFLKDWEIAEPLCTDMTVVDSLHARKALMFDRADAVLALPGGLGTLDELIEILSWRNLRLHAKPVWLMGDGGFWAPFVTLLEHVVAAGFAGADTLSYVEQLPDTAALAARLVRP
jgi:uncharacterized protein (TIGR00730 family)